MQFQRKNTVRKKPSSSRRLLLFAILILLSLTSISIHIVVYYVSRPTRSDLPGTHGEDFTFISDVTGGFLVLPLGSSGDACLFGSDHALKERVPFRVLEDDSIAVQFSSGTTRMHWDQLTLMLKPGWREEEAGHAHWRLESTEEGARMSRRCASDHSSPKLIHARKKRKRQSDSKSVLLSSDPYKLDEPTDDFIFVSDVTGGFLVLPLGSSSDACLFGPDHALKERVPFRVLEDDSIAVQFSSGTTRMYWDQLKPGWREEEAGHAHWRLESTEEGARMSRRCASDHSSPKLINARKKGGRKSDSKSVQLSSDRYKLDEPTDDRPSWCGRSVVDGRSLSTATLVGKFSTKPIFAICTCTRSVKSWRSLAKTSLQTLLIPSIERTVTEKELLGWDMRLYLGIDDDDEFWIKHSASLKHPAWLTVDPRFYHVPKHKVPFNEMMKRAYDDGAEYMVRINDDTEFLTSGWITQGVWTLRGFDPPNVGVVGPTFRKGNTAILTHDMVHRSHVDIFNHYYPTVFSAWWVDDWITKVYMPCRCVKLNEWRVAHHTDVHGTRYKRQGQEEKFLLEEVEKARERLLMAFGLQALDFNFSAAGLSAATLLTGSMPTAYRHDGGHNPLVPTPNERPTNMLEGLTKTYWLDRVAYWRHSQPTAAHPGSATPSRLPLCVGLLAYQGVKTLENTLDSYQRVGLWAFVEEAHVMFQKIDSPERRAWAEDVVQRYPRLHPIYETTNIGYDAFERLGRTCSSELVLILEEDFQVCDTMDSDAVRRQFDNAWWLLQNGVDAVRLRHRKNPGPPNHSYQTWKRTGKIEPTHLISHVFWDDHAEDNIPQIRVCREEPKTWCASSANAHYTNNPTLYRTEFARRLWSKVPSAADLEPWLTRYWSRQNFTVAYPSDAVFTHNRHDRVMGTLVEPEVHGAWRQSTLVVAAALGYGLPEFERFVVPLRRVYDGDVVVFVQPDLPSEVVVLCAEHQIQTKALPTGSRLGVKGDRYIGYAQECASYAWCFATDFRDVFVQANPFVALPEGYDLVLAEEFAPVKIRTCPYNSDWIRTCWGDDFLKEIGDNSPVCSGTILGTPVGFEALKTAMLREMERTAGRKRCTARDQGHLNYLYFANQISVPVLVEPRGKGMVNTVGYITPRETITEYLNSEGLVQNDDGTVSSVVHQYDRFPELNALVQRLATRPHLPLAFAHALRSNALSPLTEDDIVAAVCDVGFRTRRLNNLRLAKQINTWASSQTIVICVQGRSKILRTFFDTIVPKITTSFVLVTLEHDDSVPPQRTMLDAASLVAWYGWNTRAIVHAHPKLHALPIGLNKGRHLEGILAQLNAPATPSNGRVMVNFKLNRKERRRLWTLSESWSAFADRVPYNSEGSVAIRGVVGTTTNTDYYTRLKAYTFVVCPRGEGRDTHRTWEALYLGVVPIVLRSSISELYANLPVVQLNRWEDLSEQFLLDWLTQHQHTQFDWTRLSLQYWARRIAPSKL